MSAAEVVVERRAWRSGYESGLTDGYRRVWTTPVFAEIVDELVLMRTVAANLGEQADYWRERADRMELEATHWHSVVAGVAP